MGRADLQLHTDLGDGLSPPEVVLDAAERAQLDVIAITDHDDIRASFMARDEAAKRGSRVAVIPGIEVTTRSGHLLALFVEDEVPMLRPLPETIARIHELGGLAVVPHPLSYLTFSVGERALRDLAERGRDTLHHVCFVVDDLRGTLDRLSASGVELVDRFPRRGAHGDVAFLHPGASGGVLVELIDRASLAAHDR